jgi:hypothetical protein
MTEPNFDSAYQEAELERLAKLSPFEYGKARKGAAKALGVPVAFLDREVRNRRSNGRTPRFDQENQSHSFDPDLDQGQVERSKQVARSDSVLERVADIVEQLGAAGVRREAKILYLAITTRLLSHPFRPAHVLVKGASAGGKNYLVDVVAQLMPESAIYKMTGMSDRALAYLTEPMAHRFIILAETAAIEDSEIALALVRSLLSEGEIRYATVEKNEDGKLAATLKHIEGPTGLIMTTTSPRIHAENETRHLSLNIRDDWAQTQTILHEQAKLAAGKDVARVDLAPWHDFQYWLEGQERRVVVPFADQVATLVNAGPVRIRRDFPRFLALIMAHALVHQENRERDGAGRIVATLEDYEVVHDLVPRDFAETAELAHPAWIVQLVEGVRELQVSRPDGVTIHALIEHAKANAWGSTDRDVLTRRCRTAIGRGLLVNLETRRGQMARYRLSPGACEDIGLFPSVRDLDLERSTTAHDRSTSASETLGEKHEGKADLSALDSDDMGRSRQTTAAREPGRGDARADRAGGQPAGDVARGGNGDARQDPRDAAALARDLHGGVLQEAPRERVGTACAWCHEPVEPGVPGTTATSSGKHLHNHCVDEWTRA